MAGPKKMNHSAAVNRPTSNAPQKLLIPCNNGRNVYVRSTVSGANPNLAVGSEAFIAAIAANVVAGKAAKIRAELEAFAVQFPGDGWAATLADLEANGTLPVA